MAEQPEKQGIYLSFDFFKLLRKGAYWQIIDADSRKVGG